MRKQSMRKEKHVVIEDDVWIGSNSIIMVGRKIAKGGIVAAGSVVTKDLPAYSIIGGNPAIILRSRLWLYGYVFSRLIILNKNKYS